MSRGDVDTSVELAWLDTLGRRSPVARRYADVILAEIERLRAADDELIALLTEQAREGDEAVAENVRLRALVEAQGKELRELRKLAPSHWARTTEGES